MDWEFAIERQRAALLGILAPLIALATSATPSLPRHLHRFLLRLLRPAEAAARRLVIAAARTLPAPAFRAPHPRSPCPSPAILKNGVGTGIILPRGVLPPVPPRQTQPLPLVDPQRDPWARPRPAHAGVPRISFGRSTQRPAPLPPRLPLPDDPIDAARLRLRFGAVTATLNDLPAAARRFARWRARAALPSGPGEKPHLRTPLKPGRPPGWRERPFHPVQEVLVDAQWLAVTALQRPDTS